MVAGFRVFVCDNLAFKGEFFAVARKHTNRVMDEFVETIAIGVDRVQRQFQPMTEQVDAWRNHQLPDIEAKAIIYRAFIEDAVDAPKTSPGKSTGRYFEPELAGVRAAHALVAAERLHGRVQEARAAAAYRATSAWESISPLSTNLTRRGLSQLNGPLIRIFPRGGFLLRA